MKSGFDKHIPEWYIKYKKLIKGLYQRRDVMELFPVFFIGMVLAGLGTVAVLIYTVYKLLEET